MRSSRLRKTDYRSPTEPLVPLDPIRSSSRRGELSTYPTSHVPAEPRLLLKDARRRGIHRCVLVGAAVVLLVACEDPPSARISSPQLAVVADEDGRQQDDVSEFPAIPRLAVTLEARGPFRPGSPILVHFVARANREAATTRYEIFSLDDETVPSRARNLAPSLLAARSNGRLPEQAEHSLWTTITIARPGYYRILARAVGTASGVPTTALRPDTAVLNESTKTLWIVVDERGGRLTSGFDGSVIDTAHSPLFGSYGPFQPIPALRRSLTVGEGLSTTSDPGCLYHSNCGRLTYLNQDLDPDQLVGVPNTAVEGSCTDADGQPFYTSFATTDSNGYFAIDCDMSSPGYWVTASLRNQYSEVAGENGAFPGASVYATPGQYLELRVNNDYAAHVFTVINENAPLAVSKFGRSRPRLSAFVSATNAAYGIFYRVAEDRVITNYTRVFGELGVFTTMHEYGHAFQWRAIEAPLDYQCDGEHQLYSRENLRCAYTEGFADFLAVWVAGNRLTNQGGVYECCVTSDYAVERNDYRTLGDGSLIEGSVAAFFYDLVDGPNEPDSFTNEPDGEEAFDQATYPGSYIADIMRTCGFPGVTQLNGIDQFVYCAERNIGARTANPFNSWRAYASFSEAATEPGSWSQAEIRELWRFNLYNLSP